MIWYFGIGFVVAIMVFVFMIVKESSGYRDLDFSDFLVFASLGVISGIAWPATIPLFAIAGLGYFIFHLVTKE